MRIRACSKITNINQSYYSNHSHHHTISPRHEEVSSKHSSIDPSYTALSLVYRLGSHSQFYHSSGIMCLECNSLSIRSRESLSLRDLQAYNIQGNQCSLIEYTPAFSRWLEKIMNLTDNSELPRIECSRLSLEASEQTLLQNSHDSPT